MGQAGGFPNSVAELGTEPPGAAPFSLYLERTLLILPFTAFNTAVEANNEIILAQKTK